MTSAEDIRRTHRGGIIVSVGPADRFGIVPRALLEDVRLPLPARAVACWLVSQPSGWLIVIPAMCSRLGLSQDRWRAGVAPALEQAGYLTRERTRGQDGQWIWEITFNCDAGIARAAEEGAIQASTINGKTIDGGPVAGKPIDKKNTKRKSTRKDKFQSGHTPAPGGGAVSQQRAQRSVVGEKELEE